MKFPRVFIQLFYLDLSLHLLLVMMSQYVEMQVWQLFFISIYNPLRVYSFTFKTQINEIKNEYKKPAKV